MIRVGFARPVTFRARLTLRWTLAVGVLLGVANLAIYATARVSLHRWLDGHVRTLAATEAASSTDGLEDVHLHEKPFGQFDAGAFTEKLVQIFDAQGRLVLQSSGLEGLPGLIDAGHIAAALDGRAPMVSTDVQGRPLRIAVLRAMRDDRPFAVAVGLFADDVEEGLSRLAVILVTVWGISLIATATIGAGLAGRALAPVARITERAAWIARGNFDARLDAPVAHDEVGRMTLLLNSMLERLQAAVEANRRFAADASHELRAPLTAMAGELDVALRHPREAAAYRETIAHVRRRLDALTRLTGDLILLVRTQEGTRDLVRHAIDLSPLVAETFQRHADEASARQVRLSQVGIEAVRVYAEPGLFARVLDNVVANAVLYNRDGGEVVVTATVEEPPEDGSWTAPTAVIRVTDTGTGIPADQRERVFDRFYRLDQSRARRTGGSGLGLAICREVLALHGGGIEVEHSSPDGTTIAIRVAGNAVPRG
ncbi:MAG: hypothetical protein ABS36_14150 [Acidobacteria bacterium SCN 69-37]|nr:MAG: hypothetical protein ABS36_14150 [Acidobacteria bacterium SCN 69-37]